MTEPRPFGFRVRHPYVWNDEGEQIPVEGDEWVVELPHQCDAWSIAGEDDPVPHAEAVAELERFIAEAGSALAALRDRRTVGEV